MANTALDKYIDSLKVGDVIDYYGHDYEISKADQYEATLTPMWATTEEEKVEETLKVTWGDISEQVLDHFITETGTI